MKRNGDCLSARLRSATRVEHDETSSAPFITALLDGRLDRGAYAALLGQSYLFYQVLEEAGEHWRDDPVAGPFVIDALTRCAALEADLDWLDDGWRADLTPLPATEGYLERLREVCFTERHLFVAHHYARYLGDLSGGQIVRRKLHAIFGLTDDGVRFYLFDDIERVKPFKDAYRRLLDEAPWGEAEHAAMVAEVKEAFRLNREIFAGLGAMAGVA